MNQSNRSKRRTLWLCILFVGLALIFAIPKILESIPREPRIYVVNQSWAPTHSQTIRSSCGDFAAPPLGDGQSTRLELNPRAECDYHIYGFAIKGDELLRLIEMGRERREDVEILITIDNVFVDLTARFKLW